MENFTCSSANADSSLTTATKDGMNNGSWLLFNREQPQSRAI